MSTKRLSFDPGPLQNRQDLAWTGLVDAPEKVLGADVLLPLSLRDPDCSREDSGRVFRQRDGATSLFGLE